MWQIAYIVAQIASTLRHHEAMETTVLVMSGADDPATLQFIAPYTGSAVTIHDDLTKHAQGYLEIVCCSDDRLLGKPTPEMYSICIPVC